jgi:hypothetical protein
LDLAWVLDFIDDALLTIHADPEAKKKKEVLFNFLSAARKWLSGLENQSTNPNHVFAHEESAFYDLDIGLLDKPGSVLHDVNAYPLRRIRHAAIVGSDNELDSLVEAGIQAYADGRGCIMGLLGGVLVNHLKAPLRGFLKSAGDAYTNAMREQNLTSSFGAVDVRTRDFVNGIPADDPRYAFQTRAKIEPLAHDFVIPSAYQLIEKLSTACLGNWVNPAASHLSGADPHHDGKKSQDYLLDILKVIRHPMPAPETDAMASERLARSETQPRAEPA